MVEDVCVSAIPQTRQTVVGSIACFTMDYAFPSDTSQSKIYDTCFSDLATHFLQDVVNLFEELFTEDRASCSDCDSDEEMNSRLESDSIVEDDAATCLNSQTIVDSRLQDFEEKLEVLMHNIRTMNTFNEPIFEHKLVKLRGSHHSITNLSNWCLANHQHHERIVTVWLNVMKRVKIEQRVILFYLANDVVQYAKKKSLPFVDSFTPAFKKAITMVREETVRPKIERLFSIWKQRGIYDEKFLEDLSGLLTIENTNLVDIADFRPCAFYSTLRSFKQLEDATKRKLMLLTQNPTSLTDIEKMRKTFKDRDAVSNVIPAVEESLKNMKHYKSTLEAEIKERGGLIDLLESAESYYDAQHKEARIVFNAYKWFGSRVRGVKRKLEECVKELPSPPLSPDINAPSPSSSSSPDESGGNNMSFCVNFTSGRSLKDGSLLANDGLAKALSKENPGKVPSPALVYAAYNPEPAGSTSSNVGSRFYSKVFPPHSMKLPQHIGFSVNDYSADKSVPKSLHSPALPTTAYSSPRRAGCMTTSSPYSATPKLDHIEPKGHVSQINSQGNTVEVVTRSQTLDDQNKTLTTLLKSLFPGYGASEAESPVTDATELQASKTLSPKTTYPHHALVSKFPYWTDSADIFKRDDESESLESLPFLENTGYNLTEDVDLKSLFDEESSSSDEE